MLLSDALLENADAWKITVFPILQSIVIGESPRVPLQKVWNMIYSV